ncbi:MAG TPA: redox-regulated ATPase YchF [Aggregatilineales bacterium]|nr:redox-regulated ATPase YchF [Aggregatilineales bacterium]
MRLGIIGLPNSGKTTIFNALTRSNHPTGAVSSGKLEIHTAVVPVPDERIDRLSAMYTPKKTIYATITYVDIGGLEKSVGASGISGELRNQLQQVDGFIHVVRVFEDDTVPHPDVTIDPARDVNTMDTEFLLADLIVVEKRLERLDEERKKGGKIANSMQHEKETALMERFKVQLDELHPLRDLEVSDEEEKMVRGYGLMSLKSALILFNCGEQRREPEAILTYAHKATRMMSLQGRIEAEIAQLEGDDQAMFLAEYGIAEPGASRVIRASYELMHIQSFFTVGPDEVRAWTIPVGATAQESAAVIHTDLSRGFIRAEVIPYDDLIAVGSEAEIKKHGKMRLEGKEYVVRDGDILMIRAAT